MDIAPGRQSTVIETSGVSPETFWIGAAKEVISKGIKIHGYEHNPGGNNPKVYHTSEHLSNLDNHADCLARVFNLSEKELLLVKIAIAWHDTVMDYDKADLNNPVAMISRKRGARLGDIPCGSEGNEGRSARLAEEEMRKMNEKSETAIFTEEQIDRVVWAIESTYPDFVHAEFEDYPYYEIAISQNSFLKETLAKLKKKGIRGGLSLSQPYLEKFLTDGRPVPKEVVVVALADLGAAGLATCEEFSKMGDSEFRELHTNLSNPEVMHRLLTGDGKDMKDRNDRIKVSDKIISWLDDQVGFAAWQAIRFEKIIFFLKKQSSLTEGEELSLREKSCHFLENIDFAYKRAEKLKLRAQQIRSTGDDQKLFLFLAREVGYKI